MTYRVLYLLAKNRLTEAGVDFPSQDAISLLSWCFGLDRPGLAVHGEETPDKAVEARFLSAVKERAARRPLQYILGEWEFMGLSLSVGEGVLIPREDTAVLVETAARRLKALGPGPFSGLDLCAGTGAAALGLCSLLPETAITCLELSEEAFPYLTKNLAAYPQYKIRPLRGDVLKPETAASFPAGSLDFVISNPPYVKTEEIPTLQPEVQKEPVPALDGGQDGLVFYRAIFSHWAPLLRPHGLLAVEIGEGQGRAVKELFCSSGFTQVETAKDLAGLDRCVCGVKG